MAEQQSVVVTGASRGIGRAIVRLLDRRGYRVFAGVRNDDDAESLTAEGSGRVLPIRLDVAHSASVREAGAMVRNSVQDGGIRALVNNAGIVMAGPLEGLAIDDLRRQLEVNVVGVLETTQIFLPLIRTGGGRIVNVSSVSGRVATRFVGAYAASKFGLEGMSDALRLELRYWGIPVVLIEPGAVKTDIWQTSRTRAADAWQSSDPAVRQRYHRVVQRMAEQTDPPARAIGPERVAQVIARAVVARRPRARYVVGWDARIGIAARWALPTRVLDRLLCR